MLESLGYLVAFIFIVVLVTSIASLVKRWLKKFEKTEPLHPEKSLSEKIYDYLMDRNCFPSKESNAIQFKLNDNYFLLFADADDTGYFVLSAKTDFEADGKTLKNQAYKLTKEIKLAKIAIEGNEVWVRIEFYCDSLYYFTQHLDKFHSIIDYSFSMLYQYCEDIKNVDSIKSDKSKRGSTIN